MGGKSGGGARTPVIEKNTLHGANKSKHIDLISSGEIFGFEHGNDEPLKSIYLNGTPIQNKDGTLNFSGVRAEFNRGTEDQDYLPSFNSVDRNIEVGAQVKRSIPVTRTVTDSQVTSIRVTAGVDALMSTTKEGDQRGTSVSMTVMVMKNNQIYTSKLMSIEGKGSRPFRQDAMFDDLPEAPFEIRCVRNTADSNDDMLRNNTYFFNYVESIDSKMRYPMTAISGLEIDAEQFGNNTPSRTYGIKGAIVQVPSNYDPENRTYSGLWDRLFKPAFTNNPAWVLYDVLTNETDGLGLRLQGFRIDIDKFYELSKYCDELVDDGAGGKEPRFVCNAVLQGDDAYNVINSICSSFRGVCGYDGDLVTIYYDRAHDVTSIYTNSNVVDGLFDYSQVERDKQYNQIQIQYVDETNGYETTISEVSDESHIAKTGAINTLSKVGFGRTKKSYAERDALWDLVTSLTETEIVSFSVGDQGIKHEIYDIIEIADNDYVGTTIGARIKSIDGAVITLDRPIEDALKFSIETQNGSQIFTVKRQVNSKQYELTIAPLIIENAPCTAILSSVEARLFRCIQIDENDDGTYSITAIQHNPQKESIVDKGAEYIPPNTTVINPAPSISNGVVSNDGRAIILEWDSLAVVGTNNMYRIQLFKDKELYRNYETKETSLRLEKLPQGEYVAEIYAVNERGQHSGKLTIAFSTSYKIDGLRAKGIIFGIELNWHLPALITSDAFTEIWYSIENDIQTATKYAVVAYPQNSREINGLSIGDELYFWFRLVDAEGNQGEFSYSILGKPSDNADDILDYLKDKITTKELSSETVDQIISDVISDIKIDADFKDSLVKDAIDDIKNDGAFREDLITDIVSDVKDDVDTIISESELIESINKKIDQAEIEKQLLELSKISGDHAIFAETQVNRVSINDAYAEIILQKVSEATADKQLASQYLSLLVENESAKAELLLSQIALTTDSKALTQEILSLTASYLDNVASIESLREATSTEFEAQAFEISTIKTEVDGNKSEITGIKKSVVDLESASAESIEKINTGFEKSSTETILGQMSQSSSDMAQARDIASLSASHLDSNARFDQFREATATEFEANATEIRGLKTDVGANKSAVNELRESTADRFSSQAKSIEKIEAQAGENSSEITNIKKAASDLEESTAESVEKIETDFEKSSTETILGQMSQSSSDMAQARDIASLSASHLDSNARFDQFREATATEFEAQAKDISSVSAKTAENEAKITQNSSTIANIDGTVKSQYTLTTETIVDGEPYVTGFTSSQDGKNSEFVIQADKFALINKVNGEMQMPFVIADNKMFFNGDMIASGSISGDKLIAGTEIISPKIRGGELDIGDGLFKVSESGKVQIRSDAKSNVGMQISNDRIDVYDENGQLRVRIGRLR